MKWSYRIARIAGIETRVHASFAILLAWIAMTAYRQTGSIVGSAVGLLFVLLTFGSVLLHELGHALAARHYNIPTRAITIYPFGGAAEIMGNPRTPRQEVAIASAGPAVNVILALMFALGTLVTPESGMLAMLVNGLALANVGLAVLNMVPALPLDGGRVLRALLTKRFGPLRATIFATSLGKLAAIALAGAGIWYGEPWWLVAAPVLWFIGAAELKMAYIRSAAGARAYRQEASSMGETFVKDRFGKVHRVNSFES